MPKIIIFGSELAASTRRGAELSGDPLRQNQLGITFQINHEGSVSLAKLARETGIRRFVRAVTKLEWRPVENARSATPLGRAPLPQSDGDGVREALLVAHRHSAVNVVLKINRLFTLHSSPRT